MGLGCIDTLPIGFSTEFEEIKPYLACRVTSLALWDSTCFLHVL